MQTIVVGVDGSTHGEAALDFAAEEAALRGAHLRVVCAWEFPMVVAPMGVYPAESFEGLRDDVEAVVQASMARVAEVQPQVECEGVTIEGQPAAVLLKEAQDADMIVVGSRGRGSVASLLLGSVSQEVVHQASCPVVVVR